MDTSIPAPPPPPPVVVRKPDPFREKLTNKVLNFQGSQDDELSQKHGKVEDKDPSYCAEAEGSNQYLLNFSRHRGKPRNRQNRQISMLKVRTMDSKRFEE